jgi:phage/plasmid-like protein (TIGR03299 family)
MSMETREWLSNNTLIGFTEKRGNAWHYRQGDNNHYVGAIPVDDVLKRLFSWSPVKVAEQWTDPKTGALVTGKDIVIVRDDMTGAGAKLGTFTDGYQLHPYPQWLVNNVFTIVDAAGDELGVSSAVLLKGGKIASVQIETPETFRAAAGVEFRPFLTASSSFDGSISTQYGLMNTMVVCDNTLNAGLNERGKKIKIRHTRNSLDGMVQAARDALGLIHSAADDFAAEVAELTALELTSRGFDEIVAELTTVDEDASKRSVTMAQNKRDKLYGLRTDERVEPWWGTAFGGVQLLNTYRQHLQTVKGATRPERNMLNNVLGQTETQNNQDRELVLAHVG